MALADSQPQFLHTASLQDADTICMPPEPSAPPIGGDMLGRGGSDLLNVRVLGFLMVDLPSGGLGKTLAVQAQGQHQHADCTETEIGAKPKKVCM